MKLSTCGFRQARRSAELVTALVAAGHEGAEPLEKPGRDVCFLFRVSVRPKQAEKSTVPAARQVPTGAGLLRDALLSPVVLPWEWSGSQVGSFPWERTIRPT